MPVRDGVTKWVEAMQGVAEGAEISAQRWAEQYEEARPKMIENYRLDSVAYCKGLEDAGAVVGPATMEAYRTSEPVAKETLAKAVTSPPDVSPAEAERLRQENGPRVNCFCNILARTDEDKAFCNQVLEDYIFGRTEVDDMNAALAERFGKRLVKQAHKTASKHCLV